MKTVMIVAVMLTFFCLAGEAAAATHAATYTPAVSGKVVGYRLAGIEPDGDPINQTVLQTKLAASGSLPAVNLIIDSYLENFKPDTTPILPDLLHKNRKAQNLGGFLSGKALLTDDAGNIVAAGGFLGEAFLDNSNHVVIAFDRSSPGGVAGSLKGAFVLHGGGKLGMLNGSFSGTLHLPAKVLSQIRKHRGAHMKSITAIISAVTVRPHAMMGRSTTSSTVPLHTGFNQKAKAPITTPSPVLRQTGKSISPWTIAAAIGAVISFLMAGVLFWTGRKGKAPAS